MESAPQLGGLFAGGMPKLRKTGGGVNVYDSDPETNARKSSAPTVPSGVPPPRPGGAPPPLPAGAAPVPPSVASLKSNLRPTSSASLPAEPQSKPKPPPPIGKKPPIPPPASRKPSGFASKSMLNLPTHEPPRPSSSPAPSNAPPPPPPMPGNAPRPPPTPASRPAPLPPGAPPAPPPPPASRIGNVRDEDNEYDPYNYNEASTPPAPPPPPPMNGLPKQPSLAEQAARNAFGQNRTTSPAAAPPAPPPPPPPLSAPGRPSTSPAPPAPPPAPMARTETQPGTPGGVPTAGGVALGSDGTLNRLNSMGDASSYTLTNGNRSRADSGARGAAGSRFTVQDNRFKFQPEDQLPKPREFHGGPKRYRAGRGSSVPLDLKAFE